LKELKTLKLKIQVYSSTSNAIWNKNLNHIFTGCFNNYGYHTYWQW